jgi:8-oxo-dGTP pyrophosphatase MutT (NUDIX family)
LNGTSEASDGETLKPAPLTPWQLLERRQLVQRSFLTVWEDHVRLANGHEIDDFCVLEAPDWAAVLCVTPQREVVLVRQYRHGVRSASLELPAGALERGEDPLPAARRELLEETGYTSSAWQSLLTASVDPARQTATAHFFCALDAEPGAPRKLDASEDIETVLMPRDELLGAIEAGRLTHGIHIAAILMAERRGLL